MEYSKLENNIIDVLKEEQVKLGYRSEPVRLYYPLRSLNLFLGLNLNAREMQAELELFSRSMGDKLGFIGISHENERFCLLLPPQASDYVHVERAAHGEFDYLVYFEGGKPDEFRYCITDEGCHIIYHRFTKEDYFDFQFA